MAAISKTLEEALKRDTWSLDEAAWILAGFSSLNNPMKLKRLADDEEVIFGTPDYGYAKSERNKIYEVLDRYIGHGIGLTRSLRKNFGDNRSAWRLKPNTILGHLQFIPIHERIDIPWLVVAYERGLVHGDIATKASKVKASASAVFTRATANTAEAKPPKQFKMVQRESHSDLFHAWIYDEVNDICESGGERPTRDEMIRIIEDKNKSLFRKVARSPVDVKCAESIYYTDDWEEETFMTLDALRQFIYDITTSPS